MNQVFLITVGSYSNYRIVAAFSTREKAAEALEAMKLHESSYLDAEIEPIDLDATEEQYNPGLKKFYLGMAADGTLGTYCVWGGSEPLGLYIETSPYDNDRQWIYGYVMAEDIKHATKIVNEYRAQAIAEGRLINSKE